MADRHADDTGAAEVTRPADPAWVESLAERTTPVADLLDRIRRELGANSPSLDGVEPEWGDAAEVAVTAVRPPGAVHDPFAPDVATLRLPSLFEHPLEEAQRPAATPVLPLGPPVPEFAHRPASLPDAPRSALPPPPLATQPPVSVAPAPPDSPAAPVAAAPAGPPAIRWTPPPRLAGASAVRQQPVLTGPVPRRRHRAWYAGAAVAAAAAAATVLIVNGRDDPAQVPASGVPGSTGATTPSLDTLTADPADAQSDTPDPQP